MAGEFQDFISELFEPLGGVAFRRMFGGVGIFRGGIMFALIIDDALYLKTDEASRPRFVAEGVGPFVFDSRGKTVTTSYWRLPERLFDEPDAFAEWAAEALAIAERLHKTKSGKVRKPAPKVGR